MKLVFALSLLLLSSTAALAGELIHGRVEHRNALKRLNRPALPSRPLGEALEHVSHNNCKGKSGFDLAASSVSNELDKHSFEFGTLQEAVSEKKSEHTHKSPFDAKAEETDKELTIAWEQWHKSLCSNIYHHWLTYGNIPGEARVTLNISKSGDIHFELHDFYCPAHEQFSSQQREMFEHAVAQTLQMMEHADFLAFPQHSKREKVNLSTKFTFSETSDGRQGYTWKKGDYEKVHSSH